MSVIVLVLFWVITAGIIALVIGGMIFHFFAVGTIFAAASQKLKQHLEESSPKACGFCGGQIPSSEARCPACGAPRDAAAQ